MKSLLYVLATVCQWSAVAVVAYTWETSRGFDIVKCWQWYVAILLFAFANLLARQIGRMNKNVRP